MMTHANLAGGFDYGLALNSVRKATSRSYPFKLTPALYELGMLGKSGNEYR